MKRWAIQDWASWTGGRWWGEPRSPFANVRMDSREVMPNDMFVALETGLRDGHNFLSAARENGASAVMVRYPDMNLDVPQLVVTDTLAALQRAASAWRRRFSGEVIGITGSCGKTSTKDMLRQLLGAENCWATPGNLNNYLGVPLSLLGMDPELHDYAVIEAGISTRSEMEQLARWIQPDHAIVTMIGEAHLEGLGSLETVAEEKCALARAARTVWLGADSLRFAAFRNLTQQVYVLVNEADETVLPALSSNFQIIRYKQTKDAGWAGHVVGITIPGSSPANLSFRVASRSRGMTGNAVLAYAVAHSMGIDANVLSARMEQWRPARQRGEILTDGKRSFYVDCYNANPASMSDALEAFCASFVGPRLFVIGSMRELGEHWEMSHRKVGNGLMLGAEDRAILIGDGAEALREGMLSAGNTAEQIAIYADTASAREAVCEFNGNIFLKGSRYWSLEQLLPETLEATGVC